MIIITLLLWMIDKLKEKNTIKKAVSAPSRSNYGYHISAAVWEKCKGVNPSGKFNDVC